MTPAEVLKEIPEMTRDELSYYVRMSYVTPNRVQRGKLIYNDFNEEDVKLLKYAYHYISRYQMFPREAFKRARREIKQGLPMDFFIEKPPSERSLRLILLEPRPGEVVKAKVDSKIKVTATVAAIGVVDCNVSINYEQCLLHMQGKSAIIQLGSGTFVKDISWTLTILSNKRKVEQVETVVTVEAVAEAFSQIAQFKILISEV